MRARDLTPGGTYALARAPNWDTTGAYRPVTHVRLLSPGEDARGLGAVVDYRWTGGGGRQALVRDADGTTHQVAVRYLRQRLADRAPTPPARGDLVRDTAANRAGVVVDVAPRDENPWADVRWPDRSTTRYGTPDRPLARLDVLAELD